MKVYLLQHSYKYEIYQDIKAEETKIIGIYSSREKAEEVKEKFKMKKGFCRFSDDCFYIDAYEVNQDNWTDGFVTWDSEKDTLIE